MSKLTAPYCNNTHSHIWKLKMSGDQQPTTFCKYFSLHVRMLDLISRIELKNTFQDVISNTNTSNQVLQTSKLTACLLQQYRKSLKEAGNVLHLVMLMVKVTDVTTHEQCSCNQKKVQKFPVQIHRSLLSLTMKKSLEQWIIKEPNRNDNYYTIMRALQSNFEVSSL